MKARKLLSCECLIFEIGMDVASIWERMKNRIKTKAVWFGFAVTLHIILLLNVCLKPKNTLVFFKI